MRNAHLVAGLAYGDEGKGSIVDFLVRKTNAGLVVRYNGGAQAAHNVVTPEGLHHTFSQFGSGSFVPKVLTHLSRHVLINPISMMKEEEHLQSLGITDLWDRTTVEGRALIITPFHAATNRILEKSRQKDNKHHGSCGVGIGQTREFHLKYGEHALFAEDLEDEDAVRRKLTYIRNICYDQIFDIGHDWPVDKDWQLFIGPKSKKESIDWCISKYKLWPAKVVDDSYLSQTFQLLNSDVIFEGAQGLLLDEKYGFASHNTWTDITFNNANELLAKSRFSGSINKIGVIRTYFTRHGAGPFITENPTLTYPELHNNASGFQGEFRLGDFDWDLARYANNALGGVDQIALNHLDVLDKKTMQTMVIEVSKFFNLGDTPLILGFGPTAEDKVFDFEHQKINKILERIKLNVNIRAALKGSPEVWDGAAELHGSRQ